MQIQDQDKTHKSLLAALLIGVAGIPASSPATPPPSGLVPTLAPQHGFGIDGDVFARQPGADTGDWVIDAQLPGTGDGVLDINGTPLNPTTTFHFIDPFNDTASDMIFAGGNKWADDPASWGWTTGKPSSKTDINNVLLHLGIDTNGHTWAVMSADRASTSGDSYIDFELLQNPLVRLADGSFQTSGPDEGRTVGDLVLSLAFTGGGKVADFFAWRWEPDGSGGYNYVDVTAALPAGRVFVALNTTPIPVSYPAFGIMEYQPNAFAEAAIDLTALLGGFDPCESFGFETIMVKTKASASYSAGIEDFIDPIAYKLKIGPAADAGADQRRCAEDVATEFPLNGRAVAGLGSVQSVQWSVIDGTATLDDDASLVTTARVSSASATIRLEVMQSNGCVASDDVTLTAVTPPALMISGATTLCPDSVATYTGTDGMDDYHWNLTGNGVILGPTNQQTVEVLSSNACGEPVELTLIATSDVCTAAVSAVIPVEDTTAPFLTIPDNRILECPADTGTNATGVATATDDCGAVSIRYTDFQTNGCGGSLVLHREWTAADTCGNSTSAIQVIEVRDTIAPTLSLPPDLTLECPADTAPEQTGIALAEDGCGIPSVSFTDVVTPGCGSSRVIQRTWTAVDRCGNATSALQTITVQDTTPPILSAPPALTLEVPADTSTGTTGIASAEDNCGTVTVTFSDTVQSGCGDTEVITRTWAATDACGNTATAIQTISLVDTLAPTLTIPADLTLECPADTGTDATGMATAQDNGGTPEIRFSDDVTPGCGGSMTIARTWSAADACGNVTTQTQTITVQDTTAPSLTLPPNLTLECPAATTPDHTGTALATDNCGTPTVSFSDAVTAGCGASQRIARTWSAVDECGNTSSAVQMIIVQDTTAPTLSIPPNLTLECPAETAPSATGTALAQDNCGTPVVTFSDAITPGCGGSQTIARTWSARDECGNSSSAVQLIIVQDTTAPTLDLPPWITIELGESTHPDNTGWGQGEDACGTVTLHYIDKEMAQCGAGKIIGRTWRAVDECNNASYGHQRITVADTTAPTLTIPPDVVLECPADTRTNATGVATATDLSGDVTITYIDRTAEGDCGGARSIARVWIATDACGNAASLVQHITVADTTAPTVSSRSFKVQCIDDVPAPYATLAALFNDGGRASDTCDETLDIELLSDSGLVGSCPAVVTRVYRVTDNCGNFADTTQIITVDDTIAPTLSCPGPVTIAEGDSMDPAELGTAVAYDNCDPVVDVTYSDAPVPSNYQIRWYSSDPDMDTGPYRPTYVKLGPADLSCPEEAAQNGRAFAPLLHSVAYAEPDGQVDALTSLGGEPIRFGQVVPFQAVIDVSGGPGPEHGRIEFTASWSTHTTSNDRFGYDTNYMVYCAFVDPSDPGTIDPRYNARVDFYGTALVNKGTINEQITGTFALSGLDSGDRVIVEVWVVLMGSGPDKIGGTIASDLVSAHKLSDAREPITVGTQTVSIGNLSKIKELEPAVPQGPLPEAPSQPPVPPGVLVSVIDRTWTAVDDCGNQDSCVQRISVWDDSAPILTIAPLNGLLSLSWAAEPRGWWLESASSMSNPTWTPVAITPVLVDGRYVVNVPLSSPTQMFRIANGSPPLALTRLDTDRVLLTWPSLATGFQLEHCGGLPTGGWVAELSPVVVTNGLHRVEINRSEGCGFFRLSKPPQ